ncbi:hypothetical protein [Streptomyces sp. PAN_FS17]|uniref:hypothetical protein n=1 Tax=Streptomyces sp. PAN_FS17 TaxID=1855351 RepID=UPI000AAFB2D7|nr:hypothetical protein [Streptomyces sp. PAN_FS17]
MAVSALDKDPDNDWRQTQENVPPVGGTCCDVIEYSRPDLRAIEYGAVWKEARKKALTAAQVASPLAAIPYDLRHACVSFWLRSGVSLAETARRAGQSVAVLQRYYAKVLDGEEARMNALIEQGLAEQEGGSEAP